MASYSSVHSDPDPTKPVKVASGRISWAESSPSLSKSKDRDVRETSFNRSYSSNFASSSLEQ